MCEVQMFHTSSIAVHLPLWEEEIAGEALSVLF